MRISFLAVISAALTLSGCASTLPKSVTNPGTITAREIFAAIDCELQTFVNGSPGSDTLKKWDGLANINVTDTGDLQLTPSADFTATVSTPMAPVAVKVSPSGGYEDKLVGLLKLARPYTPLTGAWKTTCPDPNSAFAARGLGISDAFRKQLAFAGDDPTSKDIGSLSFDRHFTITRTVGGGISFTVGMVKVTANGNSAKSQLEAEIILSVNPPAPPEKGKGGPKNKTTDDIQRRIDQDQQNQLLRDAIVQPDL